MIKFAMQYLRAFRLLRWHRLDRAFLGPFEANRGGLDLLEFDDFIEASAGGPVPAWLVRVLWRRHIARAGGRTWIELANGKGSHGRR